MRFYFRSQFANTLIQFNYVKICIFFKKLKYVLCLCSDTVNIREQHALWVYPASAWFSYSIYLASISWLDDQESSGQPPPPLSILHKECWAYKCLPQHRASIAWVLRSNWYCEALMANIFTHWASFWLYKLFYFLNSLYSKFIWEILFYYILLTTPFSFTKIDFFHIIIYRLLSNSSS